MTSFRVVSKTQSQSACCEMSSSGGLWQHLSLPNKRFANDCANRVQVLTSELFGLQHFASNHALMHLAPTIGGLLFSATLAGNMYSVTGRAHNDPPGSCFGGDCYR